MKMTNIALTINHASQLNDLSSWRRYRRERLELELQGITPLIAATRATTQLTEDSFLAFATTREELQVEPYHEIIGSAFEDLAQGKFPILLVSMPPRTGKTRLSSLFLSWLLKKDPSTSNFVTSYNMALTRKLVSEIYKPNEYKANCNIDPVIPAALGSSLCGRVYGGNNTPGLWLIDDYNSSGNEEVNSDWLDSTWIRGVDKRAILVIGSRWGEKDIFSYFLGKFGEFHPETNPNGVVHINISGIVESEEESKNDILGRDVGGTLSDPVFRTKNLADLRRTCGEERFCWFYKGFPPKKSKFITDDEVPHLSRIRIFIDGGNSSWSKDKTGICVAGVDKEKDKLYVLEAFEGFWDFKTIETLVGLLSKVYKVEGITIEGFLCEDLIQYLGDKGFKANGLRVKGALHGSRLQIIQQANSLGKLKFTEQANLMLLEELSDTSSGNSKCISDVADSVFQAYVSLL